MNKFTRRLIDFFNSEKITYYVDQTFDDGTEDMLTVPAFLSTVPGIIVKIFVAESGKCSFAVKLGSTESEVTKNKLYSVLNDLNNRYSFVNFYIDDRKSVYMTLQFIMTTRLAFDVIDEYFGAIVSIAGRAVKEILPVIWEVELVPIVNENNEEDESDYDLSEEFDPIEQVGIEEYDFLDDSEESDESNVDTIEDSGDDDSDDLGFLIDDILIEPFSDDEESLSFDGENEDDEVDEMAELFSDDDEDEDDESDSVGVAS